MKVVDHVNQAINTYPSLYMLDNYENSTFAVLHHCLIVLGNGIEWADTGNPKTGGYLVQPRYRKLHDDWMRIKDKPYGKEKCELDPRAFKEKTFYFEEIDTDRSDTLFLIGKSNFKTVFESDLKELKEKYKVCESHVDYVPGFHTHWYFPINLYDARKNPYPNFQKKYSCFWEIEPGLIQEDWRVAGIEHLKFWQEYFNDPKRVKGYYRYKNLKELKKYIIEYYRDKPDKHPNWIQDVRDGYEIQEFDGENFEEFTSIRWDKELKNTKEFLSETLRRIS